MKMIPVDYDCTKRLLEMSDIVVGQFFDWEMKDLIVKIKHDYRD